MKQETLEEASWKYNPLKKLDGEFLRAAFKEGAKWQAERMYSDKDMIDFGGFVLQNYDGFMSGEKLLQQFKNK